MQRKLMVPDVLPYFNRTKSTSKCWRPLKKLLRAKSNSWEKNIDSFDKGNVSKFWKFSTATMNGKTDYSTPPIKKPNRDLTVDPKQKANIFLEQFSPSNGLKPHLTLTMNPLSTNVSRTPISAPYIPHLVSKN